MEISLQMLWLKQRQIGLCNSASLILLIFVTLIPLVISLSSFVSRGTLEMFLLLTDCPFPNAIFTTQRSFRFDCLSYSLHDQTIYLGLFFRRVWKIQRSTRYRTSVSGILFCYMQKQFVYKQLCYCCVSQRRFRSYRRMLTTVERQVVSC